jgi:hypothetical protein
LHITQQLASQQQLAREATQELAQVTTDNYMGFLDSVFSFYQGGTSRRHRGAPWKLRGVQKRLKGAGAKPRAREVTTRVTPRPTPSVTR